MKKKLALTIGSMALAGAVGLGVAQSSMVKAEPNLSKAEVEQEVTNQYPGTITELELDKNSEKAAYKVEIETKNKEYELKVDGNTGKIIHLDEKQRNVAGNQADEEQKYEIQDGPLVIQEKELNNQKKDDAEIKASTPTNPSPNKKVKDDKEITNKAIISHNEAINIALSEFSGQVEDVELDEDDGHLRYEIEIEKGDTEAQIELDAYTGNILIIEMDD